MDGKVDRIPTKMTAAVPLSISLFGSFEVRLENKTLVTFRSNKARALLAYLVLTRPHPIQRATLASLLWDEYGMESARVNLRQVLTNVRELLASSNLLTITHQTVALAVDSPLFWCDALVFLDLIETCQRHPHRSLLECLDCQARLRQATVLYSGVFLENFPQVDSPLFAEWRHTQRTYFADLFDNVKTILQQKMPSTGNLPTLPPLLERTTELPQLAPRLMHPVYRWLTLLGPAGVGKTQLALALGEYVQHHFPDGVWFVELVPFPFPPTGELESSVDPELLYDRIATTISHALGLSLQQPAHPTLQLIAYLRPKAALLILDNFDALGATADFTLQLLQDVPHLRVLVTARRRPHVLSQLVYRVEKLSTLPEQKPTMHAPFVPTPEN